MTASRGVLVSGVGDMEEGTEARGIEASWQDAEEH